MKRNKNILMSASVSVGLHHVDGRQKGFETWPAFRAEWGQKTYKIGKLELPTSLVFPAPAERIRSLLAQARRDVKWYQARHDALKAMLEELEKEKNGG